MKYVKCSCSSEMLAVDYDKDIRMLDLCIYKHYTNSNKLGLWDRLRYCWKALKDGQPYSDQMMISIDSPEFINLMDYLNGISKTGEQYYIYEVLKFIGTWDLYDICYWAWDSWELGDKIQFYFDFHTSGHKMPDKILSGTDLYELNIEDLEPLSTKLKALPDHWPIHKCIFKYIEEREMKKCQL